MNPRELWRLAIGPMLVPHTSAKRSRGPCGPVVFEHDLAELHECGAIAFRCRCGGTGLIVGNAWVPTHQVWDQPPLVTIRELVRARQEFNAMSAGTPARPWWWTR
jgi:hypothetical protein